MKRGVTWVPFELYGIPVDIDREYPRLAACHGFWRKRIVVGPRLMRLDTEARTAVLLHEVYHGLAHHKERRVLALIACLPLLPLWPLAKRLLLWQAHAQEYAADRFAKSEGYGVALARVLRDSHDDEFHPPRDERLRRLVQ